MNRINPSSIMVVVPCYSGRVVAELAGSLIACSGRFGAISFVQGVSHVSLVRNIIAHKFMSSNFEWLVCIDDDMAFKPEDFDTLMTPTAGFAPSDPAPTRVALSDEWEIRQNDRREYREPSPFMADVLVSAEYSSRHESLIPIRMGLGFTRIHRGVFEKIADLKHEDTGEYRAWRFRRGGETFVDYYPCGPFVSQLVPEAQWKGEDHGFFTLCMLAGILPRIETRTRLWHIGTQGFPYHGPDVGGGQ